MLVMCESLILYDMIKNELTVSLDMHPNLWM